MFKIFIIQDKTLLIYLMIMQKLDLKLFINQKDETRGTGLKILTLKQLLQRLPIALAQVKTDNNSESLLNKIRQTIYSLYQSKEITKKVYNNTIKSVQWNWI